ncbi:hypothetical protein AAC387_Pa01g3280 [Persea americana]
MYSKGEYNYSITRDLFGDGIFTVDGDRWRQQRKVVSFEFSTRVLRDFSCGVFRRNAAKMAGIVSEYAMGKQSLDIQVSRNCPVSDYVVLINSDYYTISIY